MSAPGCARETVPEKPAGSPKITSGSDFPSDAKLWIKDVEMDDSVDELKSSRSASGKIFPNFEMLEANIAFFCSQEGQPRGAESPQRGLVFTRNSFE